MKSYKFLLNITIFLLIFTFISCKNSDDKIEENVYYTCSMHQQIHESKPGNCPICHMDLVKIVEDTTDNNIIKLSASEIQLANIVVDTVKNASINEEILVSGNLVVNENNIEYITARISGRINKIYYKNIGDFIGKDVKIYEIYSENLLSTLKEYLTAIEQLEKNVNIEKYKQFINSAKSKLLLWGLTETQINNYKKISDLETFIPIYSKISGTVQEVAVSEGDYINEGAVIYKIADLSNLWVEGQVFFNDLQFIDLHKKVEINISSYPNEEFTGKIDFISPELLANSKICIIKIDFKNSENKFKPGMLATINIKTKEKSGIIVPLNAVLQSEKGKVVWIQNYDGNFEFRMVETGIENNDSIEIISGLTENEKIVISGAYLINSEFIFKNGVEPMSEMKM